MARSPGGHRGVIPGLGTASASFSCHKDLLPESLFPHCLLFYLQLESQIPNGTILITLVKTDSKFTHSKNGILTRKNWRNPNRSQFFCIKKKSYSGVNILIFAFLICPSLIKLRKPGDQDFIFLCYFMWLPFQVVPKAWFRAYHRRFRYSRHRVNDVE